MWYISFCAMGMNERKNPKYNRTNEKKIGKQSKIITKLNDWTEWNELNSKSNKFQL